jgi:predicted dehydrogenase
MAVRLGFLGCGGIANHHMVRIKDIADAEMVAFYDVDAERAKKAAETYSGQVFDSAAKLCKEAGVDAVYVCTPPFAHGELEMTAIGAGKPIFVEKPVALSMKTAREIERALNEAGLVGCAAYHFRYHEATARAEQALAGQTMTAFMGYWMGGFPGVYWWRRMDMSGGQIHEQTTHILDLARLFGGEVKALAAAYGLRCKMDVEDITVPDVGTVTLFYESGAVGSVSNCCHLDFGFRVGCDIIACNTTLQLNGNSLVVRTPSGSEELSFSNDPYLAEDSAFIKAVATGDASDIRSTYSDAVRSLALSLAANLAAEERRVVEIAELG